jgi:chromosome partitioning protein
MSIAPATLTLNRAQKELSTTTNGEIRLRSKIRPVADSYDFIFIDTPPSLGSLLSNALNACREVFIPIDVGFYSLIGIKELLTEIELIRDVNPDIYISGVLVTMYEHTKLSRDIYQAVVNEFGEKVFTSKIRKNVRLAEAPSHWMTIFKYAPSSFGAQDYMQLAKEVIKWQ